MKIEVWSDVACPWCWLGKRHLEEAIRRVGDADVEVEFRSFELQPTAGASEPVRDYLVKRYGGADGIDAAHARLREAGRRVGIHFDFDHALMSNTFDAHRIHHLAKARGRGRELIERLMKARQGEGADVADHATLRALAIDAGLEAEDVDRVLAGDDHADAVRRDEAQAVAYGIRGVPYFVLDGRIGISGAQPVETFVEAMSQAREEAARAGLPS